MLHQSLKCLFLCLAMEVHLIVQLVDTDVAVAAITIVKRLVPLLMKTGIATVFHRVMAGMSLGTATTSRLATTGPKLSLNVSLEESNENSHYRWGWIHWS